MSSFCLCAGISKKINSFCSMYSVHKEVNAKAAYASHGEERVECSPLSRLELMLHVHRKGV